MALNFDFALLGHRMSPHFAQPDGLPTKSGSSDDEAWSSLAATQFIDSRKAAENWRNGLAALIGLIATFSVVKGPDAVSGLVKWAAETVGVLLLLALLCSIFGAWMSLSAAFGTPSLIARKDFIDQGGVEGFRLRLATQTATQLRKAKVATLATIVFLTTAVGLTWYGPRSASLLLSIERRSKPAICGKLVGSIDGAIDLRPPSSEPVRVMLSDVTSVKPVSECP